MVENPKPDEDGGCVCPKPVEGAENHHVIVQTFASTQNQISVPWNPNGFDCMTEEAGVAAAIEPKAPAPLLPKAPVPTPTGLAATCPNMLSPPEAGACCCCPNEENEDGGCDPATPPTDPNDDAGKPVVGAPSCDWDICWVEPNNPEFPIDANGVGCLAPRVEEPPAPPKPKPPVLGAGAAPKVVDVE